MKIMRYWNWELIGLITAIIAIVALCMWGYRSAENDLNNYEEPIGKQVVIENDTLTVVSCSFFKGTYDLSNGLTIKDKYLETLEIIK